MEADDEFGLAMQREESACFYFIRKPEEDQWWKSNTLEHVNGATAKNG